MNRSICTAMAVLWLGCATGQEGSTVPKHAQLGDVRAVDAWANSCRHGHEGHVDFAYENVADGAAVVFTTPGDPTALRRYIYELSRAHNSSDARPTEHSFYDLPHLARFEEIEQGAKIILVAKASNDSDALRRHVQQDVLSMQRNGCQGAAQEVL